MRVFFPARYALLAGLTVASTACAPALRPAAPLATPMPRLTTTATKDDVLSSDATTRSARTIAPVDATATRPSSLGTDAHGHLPGVTFGLDVHGYESDDRITRYVAQFTGSGREEFVAQLERGTRYETMIRDRLRAAGLPDDLYYLGLIESGYETQATSRVAAVGIWQIMAGTARELGLRLDWWIDERRDPIRSTDAAVRNLKWLRSEFGSPFLAVAAYNGGPNRVSKGLAQLAVDSVRADSVRADSMRDTHTDGGEIVANTDSVDGSDAPRAIPAVAWRTTAPTDEERTATAATSADARYFALSSAGYLHLETRNYVPQLIAALLIAKEPTRYGIVVHPQSAFAYDSVRVAPLTPLAVVATAADATREQLLDLNPHVLRGLTPPGAPTMVRVPLGSGAAAAERLDALDESDRRAFRRVTTGKRETLAGVAEREGLSLRVLRRYNPRVETVTSGKKTHLAAGQALRVPTRAVLSYSRDVPDADAAPLATLPRLAAERTEAIRVTKDAPERDAEDATPAATHESGHRTTSRKATTSTASAKPRGKASAKKAMPNGKAKTHAKAHAKSSAKPNGKSKAKPNAKSSAKSGAKKHRSSE